MKPFLFFYFLLYIYYLILSGLWILLLETWVERQHPYALPILSTKTLLVESKHWDEKFESKYSRYSNAPTRKLERRLNISMEHKHICMEWYLPLINMQICFLTNIKLLSPSTFDFNLTWGASCIQSHVQKYMSNP